MEKILNTFMDEFQKNIPPALHELKAVISDHVRATAETIIRKMDLVTREEFNTQMLVLRKSREKLTDIEKRIEEMLKNTQTTPAKSQSRASRPTAVARDRSPKSASPKRPSTSKEKTVATKKNTDKPQRQDSNKKLKATAQKSNKPKNNQAKRTQDK